jgi:hypothetical protein
MYRLLCVTAVLALAACGGGGGSTPAVASDVPILYVPNTSTVVGSPLTFSDGQSTQFQPQESGGYLGTFSLQAVSGTACITATPSSLANGQSFTVAATSAAGCPTYPQTATYSVSDMYGHATTIVVQINAP